MLPLVTGTVLVSLIAMAVALPAGLLSAIYLSEFAPQTVRRVAKPALEILAGIPTVVYGYFALLFVTPLLQSLLPGLAGFNALSPGLVMGVMILPMVSSLSEDAMRSVPDGLREGAYALGATRAQAALRVVLPAALPGYVAGLKQGWAFSWRSLMAAEIIAVGGTIGFGLGSMLDQSRELADLAGVLATILVILAIGILIELVVFAPFERRMLRRRGLLQGGTR